MLSSIQLVKFFLRTGLGKYNWYIGGDILKILHGFYQGNGAAPAVWLVLSLLRVTVYKSLGFGTKM